MGYGHTRFFALPLPFSGSPEWNRRYRLSRCRKPIGSTHHRLYKPISSPCTNAWPNSRNKSTNSKSDCNARPRHPTNHPRRIHPSKDLSASRTSPQANGAHEWAILGQAPGCSVPPSDGPSIPDLVPAARAYLARTAAVSPPSGHGVATYRVARYPLGLAPRPMFKLWPATQSPATQGAANRLWPASDGLDR